MSETTVNEIKQVTSSILKTSYISSWLFFEKKVNGDCIHRPSETGVGGRGLVRLQLPQIFAKIVLLPLDKDGEKEKKQIKKILTS